MKPFRVWFASLGFAAICLIAPGCGGGEEANDGSADASGAAAAPDGAAAPEPSVAPAPAPVRAPVAAAKAEAKKADEPPAEETAQNSDASKPDAPKPDTSSATAEMLAIATNPPGPAPGTPAPVPGAAPAAGGAGQPGGAASVMGRGGPMSSQASGGAGGVGQGGPGGPGGGPGGPPRNAGRPDPGAMAREMQGNMPMANARPGAPGGPGGMAMNGRDPAGMGRPGSDKPADFRDPRGAVDAFLDALAAKDLTRLAEATALRAQEEASAKNRDLFRRIYDESLSESELSELARSLEGYKISGENPQKSTGRVEVIVGKQGANNDYYTHKITTRREKKGWGVLDIGPRLVFKSGQFNGNRRGNSQSGARGG